MKMQSKLTGKGSPVILVPGGLTGWISWENHAAILAENHTVLRVQLLNVQYGLENKPLPESYSVKTESAALAATIDSYNFTEKVDIVAWSFGAFTSLQYALDFPEKVRTLTLIEPPAMWVLRSNGKFDEATQKGADFLLNLKGDITEEMLADFLLQARFIESAHSASEHPQWNNWLQFRQSLRNSPAVVSYVDDLKRLHDFKVPTLLVKGTGSSVFLHQIIDVLDKNIPNSKVIELPGGHAPHLVAADKFMEELNRFHQNPNALKATQ